MMNRQRRHYYDVSDEIPNMQQYRDEDERNISATATTATSLSDAYTNTAKLPIETVKVLIAAVGRRPCLWTRNYNNHKRYDINLQWHEVGQEVNLPADICRIKWGHLRDNFRKVFIRNNFSHETPTTWRFYSDMRFMEKSVAENIIHQNRIKEQNRVAAFKMRFSDSYLHDTALQHSNYTEHGMHINAQQQKRIKSEPDSADEQHNNGNGSFENHAGFAAFESDENTQPDANPNDDDDDEFDEDAVTEENDHEHMRNETQHHTAKDNAFTIEEYDNSSDFATSATKTQTFKTATTPTNIEKAPTTCDEKEQKFNVELEDADRMFLLSLLPHLRRVTEQRKLHVRQKLQQVLIDEFG